MLSKSQLLFQQRQWGKALGLTPEQWKAVFMNRPKKKMLSLLDLIEQAKAN